MPKSRRRFCVEVYIPFVPNLTYYQIPHRLIYEFSMAFGGCSVNDSVEGWYVSETHTQLVPDRITLIYSDTPPHTASEERRLRRDLEALRQTLADDLGQEAILIALLPVEHVGEG